MAGQGTCLIHPSPSSSLPARASRLRASKAWRAAIIGGLALLMLAMLLSMAATRRTDGQATPAAVAGPSAVEHDLSDGDPPPDPAFRESPAKKPRLKALLIQTEPTKDSASSVSLLLYAADATRAPRIFIPHIDSVWGLHRDDPALRLHPGQAPPDAA